MKHVDLLLFMSKVPKKIVDLHNAQYQNELHNFVLYDICHQKAFNISKAAYLVDNPDFNCLKGVAGFCNQEHAAMPQTEIFKEPHSYKDFLQHSRFNHAVRSIHEPSLKGAIEKNAALDKIAHDLRIKEPACVSWHMKHDNHGILIFDNTQNYSQEFKDHLHDCMHFLCFCPVH